MPSENLDLSFDDLSEIDANMSTDADPTVFQKPSKATWDMTSSSTDYILGTVVVRCVAARNLPGVHQGFGKLIFGNKNGGSAPNPYASLRFGNTVQRTSHVFANKNPVWPRHETMYMDVTHPQQIQNKDPSASDDGFHTEKSPPETTTKPVTNKHLSTHPGDPPRKTQTNKVAESKAFAESRAIAYAKGDQISDPRAPDTPILTVAVFHAASNGSGQKYNPSKQQGDSDDVFLGTAQADLTQLITGKLRTFDQWLTLLGADEELSSIRIVCEYESSEQPLNKGDLVKFSKYCHPDDLYPASLDRVYVVETVEGDNVSISWTSPEGWVSSFLCHRFMLMCEMKHRGAVEHAQEEIASITDRLAHSPFVSTIQDTVQRLPEDGIVDIGADLWKGGLSLVGRWKEGGIERAIQDITFVTNWDGSNNPNAEDRLGTPSLDDGEAQDASPADNNISLNADPYDKNDDHDEDELQWNRTQIPSNMPACPITGEPMREPVVAADGHTYERAAIARWLKTSDRSPLTGMVLTHKNLVPNYMLISSLEQRPKDDGNGDFVDETGMSLDSTNTRAVQKSTSMDDLQEEALE